MAAAPEPPGLALAKVTVGAVMKPEPPAAVTTFSTPWPVPVKFMVSSVILT